MSRKRWFKPGLVLVGMTVAALALLGTASVAHATTLLVDSFDDGPFAFSHDQSAPLSQQQFGSMLGGERVVTLSTDRRPTTVSAAVVQDSSLLTFDTGTGNLGGLDEQGELMLIYGGENKPDRPFASHPLNLNLSNFDSLDVDIPNVLGVGQVTLILYSGLNQSSSAHVALQSPGTLQFPFSQMNGNGDFEDVDSVRLNFVGLSSDFAISIDQIRIVPEPITSLLVSTALLLVVGVPARTRTSQL